MEVYLDNSATTRVFPEVAELMTKIMCQDYGNSSSLHRKGVQAERYVREAKEILARILKVKDKELFFTSGGTESDNMAIIGCATANHRRGNHLITTQIEHPAVMQTMRYLENMGYRVTYLPVDAHGCICLDDLKNAMTADTILVSIMHTNNEVGSLQPIGEAGELIKKMNPNTLFHVDAVQGFGKAYIYPKKMKIDLLTASSHKIHGPKGVGLLYVSENVKIQPIVYGGGQQQNLRSGTENVPGIMGMAKAAQLLYEHFEQDHKRLYGLKRRFIEGVEKIEDVKVNALLPEEPYGAGTAPHVVSVSFGGVRSEVLLHSLEEEGIYVSAGSACSAHKPQPSATLKAIGVENALLGSTIRFSFSVFTTEEEIDYTLQALYDKIPMLRKFTRR
ncbi:MAG: cysteine desulfurase [Bacteroidales bacterium]|nr:cysteine desulfurase [Lachnoclostridium sp.]MCM1383211.1 cysteine desulfurase [Lachnoclostridium sp.]MCM1464564.1 cysteine desulfurase [Bacteroidales bacterium]